MPSTIRVWTTSTRSIRYMLNTSQAMSTQQGYASQLRLCPRMPNLKFRLQLPTPTNSYDWQADKIILHSHASSEDSIAFAYPVIMSSLFLCYSLAEDFSGWFLGDIVIIGVFFLSSHLYLLVGMHLRLDFFLQLILHSLCEDVYLFHLGLCLDLVGLQEMGNELKAVYHL